MGLIEEVKQVADLLKKAGEMDLYRKLVDLQGEIVNLSAEKLKTEQENTELKKRLKLKQAMEFKFPYYYQDGDRYPFCRHCWEAKEIAVHLNHPHTEDGKTHRHCHNCDTTFWDKPFPPSTSSDVYGSADGPAD